MTSPERFARVALPLPLFEPYTYRVPEALVDRVLPGARVVVPVRRRELVGIVVDDAADAPPDTVVARDILAAPDPEPALPQPLLRTAEWLSGYYGAPPGLALRAVLPSGLWGVSRVMLSLPLNTSRLRRMGGTGGAILDWLATQGGEAPIDKAARALKKSLWDAVDRLARVGALLVRVEPPDTGGAAAHERVLTIAGEPLTLLERAEVFGRARRQRALYEALEQVRGSAALRQLTGELGFGDAVVRGLVERGYARISEVTVHRDPFREEAGVEPPATPSPAQSAAIASADRLPAGTDALLYGVTGSGKTLVYLEIIGRALARGQGAIYLVPEIGLTPQTVSRVRGAFGDDVAVLHSGLSDGERADAWRALRDGRRRVAVGARSAIFAPVQRLGVVVIDEEHEASYKNGETPRYHARDVATVRARLEGARLVLGTATPSLETWIRHPPGPTRLALPERVGARPLPPVELVDLRTRPLVREAGPVPWSEALDTAAQVALQRGEQVLLLLNRRGYASYLQCHACGAVPQCQQCSIALTLHRSPPALRCHYCGHREAVPERCGECREPVQRMRGVGTQQLERLASERFPGARLARMDLDTTGTKWSHHRILGSVGRGEVDILLGTQMIAKGIDFPNVTLVGVVDADTALHLPDFRAAERTFQLLAQVAGRAGRGPKGGRVLVQTRQPGHHALVAAAAHDTEGFIAAELAHRADPLYPPNVALVNLVASGEDEQEVGRQAAWLADWCGELAETHGLPVTVLGPAPCPVARIKGRWRWHVLLKGPSGELGRMVRYAAPRLREGDVRIVLDRDPVSLL